MAPDLNLFPVSPRPTPTSAPSNTQPASGSASRQSSTPVSRRASLIHAMSPPPLPLASPGGTLPPVQSGSQQSHPFPPLSPSMNGYVDAAGVPMRHPRPMTPAEMYHELEKEQEAVVNRLTRELSALRTQTASVASTVSSTADATDQSTAHTGPMTGSTHPTSSRHHRSSSSVSRSGMPPGVYPHRYSVSSQSTTGDATHRDPARSASHVTTPRYEEVAQHRADMEEVKRENELLKQKIIDLERMIKAKEAEDQRGRSGARPAQNDVVGNTPQ
ncbi:hypothetical protein P153DRAFT_151853 [Dothidotthia symphoricarpi CBS 119687]|uniref:Uncharacterized protein n=1 Tax=Dothidotthia symphoricarpi CBS 119687 TaxID=1392245 RepID=A0A6A6AN49_9PLEO|nr:uncharacterized protein P153DRAFT_151853 [Dothidotthia symphoricarpi CBS 119687]KAF2133210.1 hypothetical protein P153DRAFT_151853 [Dothidotthia symphoricarpi CBS 119687]